MSKTSNTPKYSLDRSSAAYQKATAAGFIFGELRFMDEGPVDSGACPLMGFGLIYTMEFTCVCGRREVFQQMLSRRELHDVDHHPRIKGHCIDAVAELERHGSFSRKHLREDGYTEEQIDRIREPWDGPPSRQHERRLMDAMYSGTPYGR